MRRKLHRSVPDSRCHTSKSRSCSEMEPCKHFAGSSAVKVNPTAVTSHVTCWSRFPVAMARSPLLIRCKLARLHWNAGISCV